MSAKKHVAEKPADDAAAAFEDETMDFGPFALWSALAGGGTLFLGGAWWWRRQKRRAQEANNGTLYGRP
jgi:hypothetical protein